MSVQTLPIALDRVGNNVFHRAITTAISSTMDSKSRVGTAREHALHALQHLRPDLMENEVVPLSLLSWLIYEYATYPEVCSCCLIQEFTSRLGERLGRSVEGCFPDKSVLDPPTSTASEFCVGAPTHHCMFCGLSSTHTFTHPAPPPSPFLSTMALGLRHAGRAARSPSPFPRAHDCDRPESPVQMVLTLSPSEVAACAVVPLEPEGEIPPLELSPTPPSVDSLIPELRAVTLDDETVSQAGSSAPRPSSPPPLYSNPYGLPPPLQERTSPYFYIGGEYIKVKLYSAETRTYLPIDEAGNIILYDGAMYSIRIVDTEDAGAGNTTFVWEPMPCYRAPAPAAEEPADAAAPPPSPALSSCSSLSSDSEPSLASSDAGSDSDSSALSLRTTSTRSRRSARRSPYHRPSALALSDMRKLRAALPHEDPVDDIVPDVQAISLYEREREREPALLAPPSPVMPSCGWLAPAETFAATRAPSDSLLFADSSSSEGEDSESDYAAAGRRKTRRSPSPRHNPISRERRRPAVSGRQ